MKKLFFGVVASVKPTSVAELRSAVSKVPDATSIEVRLDDPGIRTQESLIELAEICRSVGKPVILTLRSIGQGGHKLITTEGHWDFWRGLPKSLRSLIDDGGSCVYLDWGLDLLAHCKCFPKPQLFSWSRVGASWHDFTGTSQDLSPVMEALVESPAQAFLKLVSKAQNPGAVARIKALFQNRIDPRPLIAFAMGEHGKQSRRDCLSWGSAATFGYIPGEPQTAPGQLSVDELLRSPSVRRMIRSEAL